MTENTEASFSVQFCKTHFQNSEDPESRGKVWSMEDTPLVQKGHSSELHMYKPRGHDAML